jgi:hypothetical protein
VITIRFVRTCSGVAVLSPHESVFPNGTEPEKVTDHYDKALREYAVQNGFSDHFQYIYHGV